jgi:hypothetical protein
MHDILGIRDPILLYPLYKAGIQYALNETRRPSTWYIRKSTSFDPYRRILDSKITTSLRGRPRNTAQPPPAHLAISSQATSEAEPRRRERPLGSGKTTGQRATGQRLQPSIRRQKSQYEVVEESVPISRRTRSQKLIIIVESTINTRRQRAPLTCNYCNNFGYCSINKACFGRGLQILSDFAASAAANAAHDEIANAIATRIANILAAPNAALSLLSASSLEFDDSRAIH